MNDTTATAAIAAPAPIIIWSINPETPGAEHGKFLSRHGRTGWLARTPTDSVALPGSPVNEPRGTLMLWLLSLEDLATSQRLPQHHKHLPHSGRYRILSDRADRDLTAAHFALAWDNWWHPCLMVKFAAGFEPWEIHNEPARAFAGANHFSLHRDTWYAVAFTWDHPAGQYRLYVNGYLVGTSDTFNRDFGGYLLHEQAAPDLHAGNSVIATGEVSSWPEILDRTSLRQLYEAGAGMIDASLDDHLNSVHGPSPARVPFAFTPGSDWQENFRARFDSPGDLQKLYLQGNAAAVAIANGRLEVRTGGGPIPNHATFAEQQLYMWLEEFFDGDLYVEYDFMPLAHGGLSLLLLQASGMQREDFMACYPRRTTGSMSMVCWEDVRNYHWEYFREMNDVRNDRISHAVLKNPWYHVLGYRTREGHYTLNEWHRVQFLQEGARLRCSVDGDNVLDLLDTGFGNNGPVLTAGRIAIRVMARSQIAFRNLRVFNRQERANDKSRSGWKRAGTDGIIAGDVYHDSPQSDQKHL